MYKNPLWRFLKIQILGLPRTILIQESACFNEQLRWFWCRWSSRLVQFEKLLQAACSFLLIPSSGAFSQFITLPSIVFHWEIMCFFLYFLSNFYCCFAFLIHVVNMKHLHLASRTHICLIFLSHFCPVFLSSLHYSLFIFPTSQCWYSKGSVLGYFLFSIKITQ